MKILKTISLCLLLLIMSGCSQIVSPGDLLHAPNRTNEEQTLFKAVQPFLPAGYRLTIPASYDQGSAIRLADLDGDGQQELIAFYKKNQIDYEINILILHQQNGIWEQADLITHSALNIDYVGILPVTSQKSPNLVIGFNAGDNGNGLPKELYVYTYHNSKATPIFNQTYNQIAVGDMIGEGLNQLALIPPEANMQEPQSPENFTYKVILFGSKNGKVVKLAERDTESVVINMQMGRVAADHTGLFLQIPTGGHSAYTALLVWQNHTLANVMASSKPAPKELAKRKPLPIDKPDSSASISGNNLSMTDYPANNQDINSDGIIEMALLTVPPGTETLPPLTIPYITSYYQWDGKRHLNFMQDRFEQWDYNFRIPDRWQGQYRVQLSSDPMKPQSKIRFSYPKSGQAAADLLVLRQLPHSEWKQLEEKLKKQKEAYVVLKHISAAMTGTTPYVSVALLPNQSSRLTGEALQQYKQLRLNVSEVLLLAGNTGVIPGKEAQ